MQYRSPHEQSARHPQATLCEQLARQGFVVSAADFAESISGSFIPNEKTGRGAIIDAGAHRCARMLTNKPVCVRAPAGGE